MNYLAEVFFVVLAAYASSSTAGPLSYGGCQAGCALSVCACFSAAGFTFGTVPASLIVATPALAVCNNAYAACYAACAALIITPSPKGIVSKILYGVVMGAVGLFVFLMGQKMLNELGKQSTKMFARSSKK